MDNTFIKYFTLSLFILIVFIVYLVSSKQFRIWVLQNRNGCLSVELALVMAGDLMKLANKYETEFPDDQSMFLRLHTQADELYELAMLLRRK